jgi:hypothetical protein
MTVETLEDDLFTASVELDRILSQVEYKDWKIWHERTGHVLVLKIEVPCICSRSGDEILQGFRSPLPVYPFMMWEEMEKVFLRSLMDFIIDIERHEAKETFRYNGEMIFDPHDHPYDGKL